MNMMRQIWIVSLLNFRGLKGRLWQSAVIVVGMALVAGVLLSMLSMTEGLYQAQMNSGDPSLVLVLSPAVEWEGASIVPRGELSVISNAPGLAHAKDGSAIADAELASGMPAKLRPNGARSYVPLRAIDTKGLTLRPELHLVAGRMFRPGLHELIVGVGATRRFQNMDIGDKVTLPDGQWPIVGSFATGDLGENMLMGDTQTLMASIRRKDFNSVLARATSVSGFETFRRALAANPALHVEAMRQSDWRAKTVGRFLGFLSALVYGVGVILAIGALFGCVNTMYAAVSARGREIATLRALGYGGFAVAASVVLEAAALSVAGALIGAAYAWTRYDGVETGFGSDMFKLTVSPAMIGTILLWAIAVALLGGLLPSIRAGRRPVSDALRAT